MAPAGTPAECVINISEGRDESIIGSIRRAGSAAVLDVHSDAEHHRSVLTLGGSLVDVEEAARHVAAAAVALIDLRSHSGIHPRFGAVDVVPFVPLTDAWSASTDLGPVLGARDRFAVWAAETLAVPCFLYGRERSLPEVRRSAFRPLRPDTGPPSPHPSAGAIAVGARTVLVAYNVWIGDPPDAGQTGHTGEASAALAVARALAVELRAPGLRALGLPVRGGAQVSCNLIEPTATSPGAIYDAVARGAASRGCPMRRAELVGLLPRAVLEATPPHRWAELDLSEERTIEYRMGTRAGHGPAG